MQELWDFTARHGVEMVALVVFLEQAGLPLPATPVLVLAGALAGMGSLPLGLALAAGIAASLAADLLWYRLGRAYGGRVMGWLCRLSLEPDTCVRQTAATFDRWGLYTLLFAKWLPGLNTVAPPLAGSAQIRVLPFAIYSLGGALLWVGPLLGLGYLFHHQAEAVLEALGRFGAFAGVGVSAALGVWIWWKWENRQRVLRRLRLARILPSQLTERLASRKPPVVVDLRPAREVARSGGHIPGALLLTPEEAEARLRHLPRETPLVFYCSCPDEVSSASVALKLRRLGFEEVSPLAGGFEAWVARGLPVEPVESSRE